MTQGKITASYYQHMGNDLSVVDAARVSYAKESDWDWVEGEEYIDVEGIDTNLYPVLKEADKKLVKYLGDHHHDIPFAHTAITVRCEAPLPIRTQCFKHKVGFVENEESRRYVSYTPQLFIPDVFRLKPENSKQGSGGKHPDSDGWKTTYISACGSMISLYERMIDHGVCPEQARLVLPQGVTVNWMWTGSLLAFARFYNLRSKPDAQYEVQLMAAEIDKIVRPLFPETWSALVD